MTVYAYPRLSKSDLWFLRIGGNGLGNLLFTWARCLAVANRCGWSMVWPTWKSYKPKNKRVNPYDVRMYDDLFSPTGRYVHGIHKPLVLATRRWVSEAAALAEPPGGRVVVQFRGMEGKFQPILGDRELVRNELLAMTRETHLKGYNDTEVAPVSIHVRLGDFDRSRPAEAIQKTDNTALPIDWYMEALTALRAQTGADVAARVFSDGTEEELSPLLSMPGVERAEYGSAIADLLAMSRARLLIASGSTFSMWASYLHQAPTIWYPGKWLQALHETPDTEMEWSAGDELPPGLTSMLTGSHQPPGVAQ